MGKWHPLKDHLLAVAELAGEFASVFGARREAHLAGLLHDLGKYGDLFQARLRGEVSGVDHWTMGAWTAACGYPRTALAACLATAGHHLGLPPQAKETIAALNPEKYVGDHRRLSEKNLGLLLQRQRADGIKLPSPEDFLGEVTGAGLIEPAAAMLDYRMLFSALVDADFLDTEAHFNREPDGIKRLRPAGPELNAAWALDTLLAHIQALAAGSSSSAKVNQLRDDLLHLCLQAAKSRPGRFTLSAPTGSGKTLAMLAFALGHAAAHGLRRVVMVIPYLSIIEQTVKVFRGVLKAKLPPGTAVEHYILEHHSMAGLGREPEGDDAEDRAERRRRELAQNWDAPIIVTTSVQMLESLFAHRPGACRKLHRLANSVILFDEVQTLPTHLAATTLAALGRLCDRFGASVVFSTATQPAFGELSDKAERLGGRPWAPMEIAPPKARLFQRAKRVCVHWPPRDESLSLAEVAAELAKEENRRSLCVVNLKRQARGILQALQEAGSQGLFHLSTSMCSAHREKVLHRVRGLLQDESRPPVRLVSTQCVEAGVDLDFPVVWRAWGPLTSIAQAAGRCNRNGKLEVGRVRVFRPWEENQQTGRPLRSYPDDAYQQAAQATDVVLAQCGPQGTDIDDPELFRAFYRQLYRQAGTAGQFNELEEAIRQRHFDNTARLYRLIDNDSVNVLVPYDRVAYDELAQQAREEGLSHAWMAKARPHTVGLFRPRGDSPLTTALEPIPLLGRGNQSRKDMSRDWFICPEEGMYDQVVGFVTPEYLGLLML